jgi:hypothetical protein
MVTVVYGVDCLACKEEFFMINPSDVKRNEDPAFTCLVFIELGEFGFFVYGSCLLSRILV